MVVNYSEFPLEFEPSVYRARNEDLQSLSDEELKYHFDNHGRGEGRISGPITSRDDFIELIPSGASCLEIGPFDTPCVVGANVHYLDLLSQIDLQTRADELGRSASNVPPIKWVAKNGRLDVVTEKYDVLFSSHNIEHQFDLIEHLEQASTVLHKNGYYFLIVPDSRYCFDHFIASSTIADVLEAYEQKPKKHLLRSVIEHRALTTHNDPVRHWAGDHDPKPLDEQNVRDAIVEFHSTDEILDVHAWQFTPDSFREIFECLFKMQLSEFKPIRVFHTLRNTYEFMAILAKQ